MSAVMIAVTIGMAEAGSASQDRLPYCGVNCVAAAASALGKEVSYFDLINRKFIGSSLGSTPSELQSAVKSLGFVSYSMGSCNPYLLYAVDQPTILRIKRRFSPSSIGTHWICFLGWRDGQLKIFDGESSIKFMSVSELCTIWDGSAIIVARTPSDLGWVRFAYFCFIVSICGFYTALAVAIYFMIRRGYSRKVIVAALFVGVGIQIGVSFAAPHGLLRDAICNSIRVRANAAQITEVTVIPDWNSQSETQQLLLIDARFSKDFQLGAIPGAINLSVDATEEVFDKVTALAYEAESIVVYCQSEDCAFSDFVADELSRYLERQVAIYRGGYREWIERHQKNHDSE